MTTQLRRIDQNALSATPLLDDARSSKSWSADGRDVGRADVALNTSRTAPS
jgi:hypothetical protein